MLSFNDDHSHQKLAGIRSTWHHRDNPKYMQAFPAYIQLSTTNNPPALIIFVFTDKTLPIWKTV